MNTSTIYRARQRQFIQSLSKKHQALDPKRKKKNESSRNTVPGSCKTSIYPIMIL